MSKEIDEDPWQTNTCPLENQAAHCKSPIFATGYHTCGSKQTRSICFIFKNKLQVTVAMDLELAKDLGKALLTEEKDMKEITKEP